MARGKQAETKKTQGKKYSRRDFVVGGGTVLAGGALAAYIPATTSAATKAAKNAYALSTGYLVYDSRRCSGCQSCMIACSLVHEGVAGTSLSRIQVSRAILASYPYDIQISVCRQCPEPMCVKSCPAGACHVSAANGNIRMIDAAKCTGCGECLKACPHSPHRTVWNPASNKAAKCDLCANAPDFSKKGGPAGSQACITTCPMTARYLNRRKSLHMQAHEILETCEGKCAKKKVYVTYFVIFTASVDPDPAAFNKDGSLRAYY